MQLLLALAAYLLVTAVLKSTLDLSKSTCCILAVGAPLSDSACAAFSAQFCMHCAEIHVLSWLQLSEYLGSIGALQAWQCCHHRGEPCTHAAGVAQQLSARCSWEATTAGYSASPQEAPASISMRSWELQSVLPAAGTLLLVSLVLFVPWNTGGLWAEPAEGQQAPLLESRGAAAGLLAEMASEDALKADQQVRHLALCLSFHTILAAQDGEEPSEPAMLEPGVWEFYMNGPVPPRGMSSEGPPREKQLWNCVGVPRTCFCPKYDGGKAEGRCSIQARVALQERAEAVEEQALKGTPAAPLPELSPLQCLISVSFWLLFTSFCVGVNPPSWPGWCQSWISCNSLRLLQLHELRSQKQGTIMSLRW